MRGKGLIVPPCYSRGGKILQTEKVDATSSSSYEMILNGNGKKNRKRKSLQELYTTGDIVNTVLLNDDAPTLGSEFDSLPSGASFSYNVDC